MEYFPAIPAAEGPHWGMNAARTHWGHPVTGDIIKKYKPLRKKRRLPQIRLSCKFGNYQIYFTFRF